MIMCWVNRILTPTLDLSPAKYALCFLESIKILRMCKQHIMATSFSGSPLSASIVLETTMEKRDPGDKFLHILDEGNPGN